MERHWYAVHTYSGHENKVKTNIERRAQSLGLTAIVAGVISFFASFGVAALVLG